MLDRHQQPFDGRGLLRPSSAGFEVIHRRAGVSLRYYAPGGADTRILRPRDPLVLVPPLGIDPRIYDRRSEHSLVAYLSARGFDLYLVDWGWPARADARRRLADYFAGLLPEMLGRVRLHSGSRALSLHGWQLGGVFALCCAALSSPRDIARLVLLDTAIDYHADSVPGVSRPALWQRAGRWRRLTDLRAARLPARFLYAPAWAQGVALAALRGRRDPAADVDLLCHRAYPGAAVADIIDYLLADNMLAHGRLPMRGAPSTLAAVRVPIVHLSDREQPVCSPVCGQRLAEVVASRDVVSEWIKPDPDGAVGGALTARRSWARVADWLIDKEQSG